MKQYKSKRSSLSRLLYNIIMCAAISVGTTACSNWLDMQPYDEIAEDELLSTEDGYEELLNGVYIDLCTDALYGKTLTVEMVEMMGGAYTIGTDNSVWGNYQDLRDQEYSNEYWSDRLDQTWNKAYALILNCNQILTRIDGDQGLFTGNKYRLIKGEALALRAMLHFDMLRLFGPVYAKDSTKTAIPYYKQQTNTPEEILTAHEVATLVKADLTEARTLLGIDPIRTEGRLMTENPDGSGDNSLRYRALRLNYYAVCGLLARVCLYTGDKPSAFNYATEVIRTQTDGIFPFVERSAVSGSASDPDRIFSTEVMFALSHATRGQLFTDYFDPTRSPNYVFRMDGDLLSTVVYGGASTTGGYTDDYRYRACWRTTGQNSYFYKYDDLTDEGAIENTMIPMLRLGEMYLIAAEAQGDDLAQGAQYVNALRRHRGVSALTTLTNDLLKYEYIRELYGEGQLFYLYKRLYCPVIASTSSTQNPQPSDKLFVLPLPDTETENR